MIQDIYPSKLHNEYVNCEMTADDNCLVFSEDGRILLGEKDGQILFPKGALYLDQKTVYLFALDEERFFLAPEATAKVTAGFSFYRIREARDRFLGKELFAVFTAYHLWEWYTDNIYCGKCASRLKFDDKERALRCPVCDSVIYPRINPAVIVAVLKGDSLLITRYRRGFAHNALIAGFTEIGETLEETVAREVMEETGIKVKNIRYYKSQPWGMAQDILVGYFCEADGDGTIRMDEDELKYAEWVKREDIVLQPTNLSLTNEMMNEVKEGRVTVQGNDDGT